MDAYNGPVGTSTGWRAGEVGLPAIADGVARHRPGERLPLRGRSCLGDDEGHRHQARRRGPLRQAIDGAQVLGVPALYAPMAFVAEDYADQELQRRTGIGRIMFELRMFQAGTWGADFHPDL